VRYFGGTKLGVGGLIEAYREATFAALDAGTVVERFVQVRFLLRFPYARMSEVMGLLKRNGLTSVNKDFQLVCQLEFSIRRNESESIARQLSTMDGVTFTLSSPLDNTTD
jgi:putative IMPACT (imprinted ancient) family translation regulator